MREAIGDVLPLAVGAAISPFPIIGVVLMLVTPRGRVNGTLFVLGWLVGLAVVGAIGLALGGAIGASDDGAPSDSANVVQVALGLGLVVLAVRQWRKRPAAEADVELPGWMSAVDGFGPLQSAGTGVAMSAVNPKNLVLTVAAATTIASTGLPVEEQIGAYAVYVVIASLGVAIPLVLALVLGERSAPILDDLRTWLARHNAAIMAAILLVIGARLVGQGIGG